MLESNYNIIDRWSMLWLHYICLRAFYSCGFLQRVSIACYAEHCTSYRKSVRLSGCLSHAGTVSKRLKLRSWGLHCRI